MDNNELRIKIAQAQGWTELHPHTNDPHKWRVLDGLEGIGAEYTFLVETPNWPASISDAWGLVEEGKLEGCDIHIETDDDNPGQWKCLFWDLADAKDNRHRATAETAPRAICLAWLAWKEVRNDVTR